MKQQLAVFAEVKRTDTLMLMTEGEAGQSRGSQNNS